VTFTLAFGLDLAAGLLVLVLVGAAALSVGRRRRVMGLLVAGFGLLVIRAAVDVGLAGSGWIFAGRRIAVDLPLAAVPVLLGLLGVLVSEWRRFEVGLVRVAAGCCAIAAVDPVLLPGRIALAALGVVALIWPWPTGSRLRPLVRTGLRVVAGVAVVVLVVPVGLGWWQSRLPGRYDLADYAQMDDGGAEGSGHAESSGHGQPDSAATVPVTALTGPGGTPDVRVALTAAPLTVRRDGRTVQAVAFNGTIPGPPIQARLGDLVQVHVCNHGDLDGVSVHWHGYDVPNAEDGVAGVTQQAIPDGGCYDYRFRADQLGSYWYHAHQASSSQVDRGLYGALVVAPRSVSSNDLTVLDHAWRPPGGFLAGAIWQPGSDAGAGAERMAVAAGTTVRLRLVNTDRLPHRYRLAGAPFRLTAIDGTDVIAPTALDDATSLLLAAGGRYDLDVTMPPGGVRLTGLGDGVSVLLSPGMDGAVPAIPTTATHDLDLLDYGSPTAAVTALRGRPDRDFSLVIDQRIGFAGGKVGYRWAVNGRTYPRMPMLMVTEGDLVRVRLVNRTTADHPIHLHGHHLLVLSRNGRPSTGSPWWTDTLNVAPGQDYEVVFRADNLGIWMDHCHDLRHAAAGFVLHLAYTGVSTPFRIGDDTPNQPE
jgi:FtsP/CotA-like multicopper oxidase with cupredoxin domain